MQIPFDNRLALLLAILLVLSIGALLGNYNLSSQVGKPTADKEGVLLEELVEEAGVIVSGQITEVKSGHHPSFPRIPALLVTIQVRDMLKGSSKSEHTFMLFRPGHQHATRFEEGELTLLFLAPESDAGFTSPLLPKGKFIISEQSTGQWSLSDRELATINLSDRQRSSLITYEEYVDYDSLVTLIIALERASSRN